MPTIITRCCMADTMLTITQLFFSTLVNCMYVALWKAYIWQSKVPLPQTLASVFSTRLLVVIKSRFIPTNFKALPAITFSVLTSLDLCSNYFYWKVYNCPDRAARYIKHNSTYIIIQHTNLYNSWHTTNNNLKNKLLHSSIQLCNIND